MKIKQSKLIPLLLSVFLFASCGDSKKEASANDNTKDISTEIVNHLKKSESVINSANKDNIAKYLEEKEKLEARAKEFGIDINDPSTYPESLKKALAEMKSDHLPAAKDKAKEMLNDTPEIPESAKEMMKKAIDSAGEE